ncbi:Hypothetical predicted protein, partial [Pelobates cultripes]
KTEHYTPSIELFVHQALTLLSASKSKSLYATHSKTWILVGETDKGNSGGNR